MKISLVTFSFSKCNQRQQAINLEKSPQGHERDAHISQCFFVKRSRLVQHIKNLYPGQTKNQKIT